MKQLILSFLALFGISSTSMAADISPSQMTDELRSMVLKLNPNDIGITKENYPHPVFAIIMETGFPDGSFTLSAIADGSTSLYFSSGGGVIGAGEHENVRKASNLFLSQAQKFYSSGRKTTSFPKPKNGIVFFYFVTFEGVRIYSAAETKLGNEKDALSDLFFAAHSVITEIREIEETLN